MKLLMPHLAGQLIHLEAQQPGNLSGSVKLSSPFHIFSIACPDLAASRHSRVYALQRHATHAPRSLIEPTLMRPRVTRHPLRSRFMRRIDPPPVALPLSGARSSLPKSWSIPCNNKSRRRSIPVKGDGALLFVDCPGAQESRFAPTIIQEASPWRVRSSASILRVNGQEELYPAASCRIVRAPLPFVLSGTRTPCRSYTRYMRSSVRVTCGRMTARTPIGSSLPMPMHGRTLPHGRWIISHGITGPKNAHHNVWCIDVKERLGASIGGGQVGASLLHKFSLGLHVDGWQGCGSRIGRLKVQDASFTAWCPKLLSGVLIPQKRAQACRLRPFHEPCSFRFRAGVPILRRGRETAWPKLPLSCPFHVHASGDPSGQPFLPSRRPSGSS